MPLSHRRCRSNRSRAAPSSNCPPWPLVIQRGENRFKLAVDATYRECSIHRGGDVPRCIGKRMRPCRPATTRGVSDNGPACLLPNLNGPVYSRRPDDRTVPDVAGRLDRLRRPILVGEDHFGCAGRNYAGKPSWDSLANITPR